MNSKRYDHINCLLFSFGDDSDINLALTGMFKKISLVVLVGLAAWFYNVIQPPAPAICGTPNGPPVTSSRIKLRDGRHLAYLEAGVPKAKAAHKIIYIHGFASCKHDLLPVSPVTIMFRTPFYVLLILVPSMSTFLEKLIDA